MSKRFEALGRFEVPKVKPRHQSLNDALRNSRSEAHEAKHGIQKRSRMEKHFKKSVQEWLNNEEDFDYDY